MSRLKHPPLYQCFFYSERVRHHSKVGRICGIFLGLKLMIAPRNLTFSVRQRRLRPSTSKPLTMARTISCRLSSSKTTLYATSWWLITDFSDFYKQEEKKISLRKAALASASHMPHRRRLCQPQEITRMATIRVHIQVLGSVGSPHTRASLTRSCTNRSTHTFVVTCNARTDMTEHTL